MPKPKQTNKAIDNKIFSQVSDIIKFMGNSNLAEISLETADLKLNLRKNASCMQISQTISNQQEQNKQIEIPTRIPQKLVKQDSKTETETNNFEKIHSPMTGTFYTSPSPTSKPFVEEGNRVKKGQTVCIVEAMKMMNEIKADCNGTIIKVLIENGAPVEKGTALFDFERDN